MSLCPQEQTGASIFSVIACMNHCIWNKIHMEMHKPEDRFFTRWSVYKFLARHRYLHHRYSNKNFNVVFLLADYVLGTNARANEADLSGHAGRRTFIVRSSEFSPDLSQAHSMPDATLSLCLICRLSLR